MFTFVPKRISLLNYLSSRGTVRKVLNYFCEIYNLRYYDSVLFTCLFGIIKEAREPARKKFFVIGLNFKKVFFDQIKLIYELFLKKGLEIFRVFL